jgi:ABC-2 type transport system ATP-binding protein/lipopolysaccharide transport system ATP-binding protein
MSQPHIELRNVSMYREMVGHESRQTKKTVLDDVSINIGVGERIALLGSNGAGKSTLLRLMAGIYKPDEGSIESKGDFSVFLDAGFGVDMRLTGRENCYSRGVITGVPSNQIDEFIQWVSEFSELGDYFDQPLRTYSTGMIVRLVFSMCTARTHDVLLIDEGIGTADTRFQEKAFSRLFHLYNSTPILVLASHNADMLKQNCTRGIVISKGKVLFDGEINESIALYQQS